MKSEKRKKITFSIIFMVCLVASSSFSIPQADFSLPTIAIISDSQDKLVQKTAQSIYSTIIGFGFPRVNYITASDIEDVVTELSQNNYITILVFHYPYLHLHVILEILRAKTLAVLAIFVNPLYRKSPPRSSLCDFWR